MDRWLHNCKCCNCALPLPFVFMFDKEPMCNRCFWWAWRILEEGKLEND